MLIKKMNYKDFDGNDVTDEFLFNLTEAEVSEWLLTNEGYTIDKVLNSMAKKRNARDIILAVKDLILRSYGEKSLDGRRFIKKDPIDGHNLSDDFAATNAFSDLLLSLVTDAEAASTFMKAILPEDLAKNVDNISKEQLDLKASN